MSVLLTTQKYNLVPLQLRNAASTLVLFDMNRTESKIVHAEIGDDTFDEWEKMTQHVFDAPYHFLFVRIDRPSRPVNYRYHKCFDRIVFPST